MRPGMGNFRLICADYSNKWQANSRRSLLGTPVVFVGHPGTRPGSSRLTRHFLPEAGEFEFYSPNLGEGSFSELRLQGVIGNLCLTPRGDDASVPTYSDAEGVSMAAKRCAFVV